MWIARLDMLSRNEDLQAKLFAARECDLVVCDEAHRMSASYFGGEVKYTQRYQLGQRLSGRCRHFLLMTATPHSGKEARLPAVSREGVHQGDPSDLLRRLTKEELRTFDGRPCSRSGGRTPSTTSSRPRRPISTRRSPTTRTMR